MKQLTNFIGIIFLLLLVSTSCKKNEPVTGNEDIVRTMNDLEISDSFDWKTTKTIYVNITLPDDDFSQIVKIMSVDEEQLFYIGYATNNNLVSTKITIPTSVTTVKVRYGFDQTYDPMAVSAESDIIFNFNNFKLSRVACDLDGFVTYSQGGWGQKNGPVGQLRDAHFTTVFPSGLTVGTTTDYSLFFATTDDVEDYLPGGGKSKVLTHNYTNPSHKEGGNWAAQITAAMFNVHYDKDGHTGTNSLQLGDLVFASGTFKDITVFDFLDIANKALSGDGFSGYSIKKIQAAAEGINLNFHEGTQNNGLLTCPDGSGGSGGDECGCEKGLRSLTMRYEGTTTATIKVREKKSGVLLYCGTLDPNETFSFTGSGSDGKMDKTIYFYINNVQNTSMHTSCSVDLEAGDEYVDFVIMSGTSKNNLPLCGDPPPPPGGGGGSGGGNSTATFDGCLAYEDLWPGKGDYDFNDLIVDYDFKVTKDEQERVLSITGVFTVYAYGASYHNGFGFILPNVSPDQLISVTGYEIENGSMYNLNANGLEDNQPAATIIVYDDAYNILPHPGGSIGVNTEESGTYVEPDSIVIQMVFNENGSFATGGPITFSDLDIGNFNPFIIVDQDRNVEVHLRDFAPSALADQSLLGTFDDDSNPSQSRYYTTLNNLPWAINIPVLFEYPIEKQDVVGVHLKFADWAESGGTIYTDWYLDLPGYRNDALIYTAP
jgi:LruC domain-containing protein